MGWRSVSVMVALVALQPFRPAVAQDVAPFVYCMATDGHYALFTDVIQVSNAGSQITLITTRWQQSLSSAHPQLDFSQSTTMDAGHCTISSGGDYLAAKAQRDQDLANMMSVDHASRSFMANFRP